MGEKTSEMMLCCLTPMIQQHPPYSEGTVFAHCGSSCLMDKSESPVCQTGIQFVLVIVFFFSSSCTTWVKYLCINCGCQE